jgi:uncharacterized protein (TIGR00299 family) protein
MIMRAIHVDPVGGAAGDMLLAALLDLGVPIADVRRALGTLPLPAASYELSAERVEGGGFAATRVTVTVGEGGESHRSLDDLLGILSASRLEPGARDRAERVFRKLAAAESRVHAVPVEAVHFHEVGAVDAIVDIVGCAVALDLLAVEEIRFGVLAPGTGMIESAHGPLPLPAPATLELLHGVPIRLGGPPGEWVTPTGAAILTALGQPVSHEASLRVERVGSGAGHRPRADRPNIVRLLLGELEEAAAGAGPAAGDIDREEIMVLEAAIDDQAPNALSHAAEVLRAAGAIDVYLAAVGMKKGRLGTMITVLARPGAAEELASCLLRETSTLGLRLRREERRYLCREIREVATRYGKVRVKETLRPPLADRDGRDRPPAAGAGDRGVIDAMPETDDVASAAGRHGVPFSVVHAAAMEAWRRESGDPGQAS